MCDPVTMAATMGTISAIQTVGQYQQGSTQADLINQQYAKQSDQLTDATSAQLNERARESRKARERLRVLGGEAGISGNSFETTLLDTFQQQGMDNAQMLKNYSNQQDALETQTQSQLNQIQLPTVLGAALQIGQGALSGYAAGVGMQGSAQATPPLK